MDKLVSFLGIIRKSASLTFGCDSVKRSIIDGKSSLIVVTSDLSERSKSKFEKLARLHNVDILSIKHSMDDLERVFLKKVGIISINDKSLSKKIIELGDTIYDEKIQST